MTTLTTLWLPILVAGIVVFVASALAWMVMPHHKSDWKKLADEDKFSQAVNDMAIPPGQYIFPCYDSPDEMKSDEFRERTRRGPWGTLFVWNSAPNMGKNMLCTFVFYLVVSFIIAYLGRISLQSGADSWEVFRFVATAGVLAYCCAGVPNAIWFKKRMRNDILDGIVYGLLTGAVFALLWPSAA